MLAADQGHTRSQYKVADLLESGAGGVEQDLIRAHLWFSLAARDRYEDAKRRRKRVAKQMDLFEIAEAEMLARQWRNKRREGS